MLLGACVVLFGVLGLLGWRMYSVAFNDDLVFDTSPVTDLTTQPEDSGAPTSPTSLSSDVDAAVVQANASTVPDKDASAVAESTAAKTEIAAKAKDHKSRETVSYTHLTLPTICSV